METIILDETEDDNIYSGDVWTVYLCAYPTPRGLGIAVMRDEVIGTVDFDASFHEDGSIEIPDEINGLWTKGIDGGDKIIGHDQVLDSNYQPLELIASKKPELEIIKAWFKRVPFNPDNAEEIITLWDELFGNGGALQDPEVRPKEEPDFQSTHRGKTTLAEHIPDEKMGDFASALVKLTDKKWQANKLKIETDFLNSLKKTNWRGENRNISASKTSVNSVEMETDLLIKNNEVLIHCVVRPSMLRQEGVQQVVNYVRNIEKSLEENNIVLILFKEFIEDTLVTVNGLGNNVATGKIVEHPQGKTKLTLIQGPPYLADIFSAYNGNNFS